MLSLGGTFRKAKVTGIEQEINPSLELGGEVRLTILSGIIRLSVVFKPIPQMSSPREGVKLGERMNTNI